MLQHNLTALN